MSIISVSFTVLLIVLGASALPRRHASAPGYARLNHTVGPTPDACTISSVNDIASVVASCTTITFGSVTVPAGNQPIIMNLKQGTTLTFTGEVSFSYHSFSGYLMEIIGAGITVQGTNTHLLHGHGELYWDGKGGAGIAKPTFLYLKGTGGSTFNGLSIKNCPERCVGIDGSNNIIVENFLIDNKAGAPGTAASGKEGHNTDGFDIAKSQYVTIKNSVVYNQDDCVAINSGAHMLIDHVTCDGSHGFDIATGMSTSDQNQNIVNNITFQNSQLYHGMYGLHILTCSDGGKGYVKDITYKNITFSGPSDYGIMVQQDFSNSQQGSTGVPVGNVPIYNVNYYDITGAMDGQYSYALSIRCASGTCTGINFSNVKITGATSANECINYQISGWC